MNFLNSNQIRIFPVSNRTAQPDARLTTAYNLVNIINRLVDKDSFVVDYKAPTTKDDGSIGDDGSISFNIKGYLIEISPLKDLLDLFTSATDIYAIVKISNTSNTTNSDINYKLQEIEGTDNNSKYEGVDFTADKKSIDSTKSYLHILEREDSESPWNVPANSRIKFKTDGESRSIYIDDGDLD